MNELFAGVIFQYVQLFKEVKHWIKYRRGLFKHQRELEDKGWIISPKGKMHKVLFYPLEDRLEAEAKKVALQTGARHIEKRKIKGVIVYVVYPKYKALTAKELRWLVGLPFGVAIASLAVFMWL